MKILSIKLHNFRRLPHIDLRNVEIDFKNKLNLILGGNGAGKSMLMRELSPLPSNKEDFYPGGYKYIVIEHKKHIYRLSSEFEEKPKFSFVYDDEELNPGFTVTVQKELAYKHFGIDQDIHELLIGATTFTGMSTVTRKKILNAVSNINIDYVLGVYEKIVEELREKTSKLKLESNMMQMELAKLVSPHEEEVVRRDVKLIKEVIDSLLTLRAGCIKPASFSTREVVSEYIKTLSETFEEQRRHYYTYFTSYPRNEITTMETELKSKLGILDFQFTSLYKELQELSDTKHILETTVQDSDIDIKSSITAADKAVAGIEKSLTIFKDIHLDDVAGKRHLLTSIQYSLMDTLNEMPSNEDRYFGRNTMVSKETSRRENNELLIKVNATLYQVNKDIEHVSDHLENDVTTCPACLHKWNINYSSAHLDDLVVKKERCVKKKNELEKVIAESTTYIEACAAYFDQYRKVMAPRNNHRIVCNDHDVGLGAMWDYIDKNDLVLVKPKAVLTTIDTSLRELALIAEAQKHMSTKQELEEKLKISELRVSTDIEALLLNIKTIESKISTLTTERENLQKELADLTLAKGAYLHIRTLLDQFKRETDILNSATEDMLLDAVLTLIDDTIRDYKIKLIDKQSQLEDSDRINYLVDKYKKQISVTQTEMHVLDAMVKELSPKNGLIAKTIGTFINKLISNVNAIISSIWSYDFSIVPYNAESEDKLDYRFKVMVHKQVVSPDVTKTSGGMREIVDLSFRLTIMRILGMDDYPVYLDEFGVRLDTEHRSKIHMLISEFIANTKYSQIFLITHLDTSYSNIRDTDIIVVDGSTFGKADSKNILRAS